MLRPILVSACLLGLHTRYDGQAMANPKVAQYLADHRLLPIPICPEQLAGLPTPRTATFFSRGDGEAVIYGHGMLTTTENREMTDCFLHGAKQALEIAQLTHCTEALLKERSPSCGVHRVYLNDTLIEGTGVTCALFKRHGLRVFSEEDL